MDDWDRHLPQVMGAYNSTELSTTGISPHMMLNGQKKALPLTFFYPEYEGKRTAPQTYVRRTSMTFVGGTRKRRKLDKRGGLIKGQSMQKTTQVATTSGFSRSCFHQKEPRNL